MSSFSLQPPCECTNEHSTPTGHGRGCPGLERLVLTPVPLLPGTQLGRQGWYTGQGRAGLHGRVPGTARTTDSVRIHLHHYTLRHDSYFTHSSEDPSPGAFLGYPQQVAGGGGGGGNEHMLPCSVSKGRSLGVRHAGPVS